MQTAWLGHRERSRRRKRALGYFLTIKYRQFGRLCRLAVGGIQRAELVFRAEKCISAAVTFCFASWVMEPSPESSQQPQPTSSAAPEPESYFAELVDHTFAFAQAARARGTPLVGIMCEFTPRELILAAGAIPVCLCGGSAGTIPAAEQYLPVNLCPLVKSTFGYHVMGTNPFLQWADLVVAETTCDAKKKMFELMASTRPMYVLELPQKAQDPNALEWWISQVQKFRDYLERFFEVRITSARLHEAVQFMNRERRVRRDLADLMTPDLPSLTGRQLLDFRSMASGNPDELAQYEQALLKYRSIAATPPQGGRRLVRVLLTGVPLVRGAERVVELIESCGARVVCMENCTGLKPILEDVDLTAQDLVRAIAEKYYHLPCSVMTPNNHRFESLRALSAKFRPDCIIELVWHACLTYDVESIETRRLSEHELGLPYLKISTDYSPADSARILARVGALIETVSAGAGSR